eukprot:Gb_19325 [translate_table: standard]
MPFILKTFPDPKSTVRVAIKGQAD